MKKILFLFLTTCYLLLTTSAYAEDRPLYYKDEFFKAEVIQIIKDGEKQFGQIKNPYQEVKLKILDSDQKDKEITVEHGSTFRLQDKQKVKVGEKIVLLKSTNASGEASYHITDKYRLDNIYIFIILFLGLVLVISRWKGLGSIIGLAVSFIVIIGFIIPRILQGQDPVLISILGSGFIMFTTIYLAHGFSKKTTIALISTFITLVVTGLIGLLAVSSTKLTGLGSEAAYSLTFGFQNINLNGLLLGGLIIGALGVLDDITTAQAAAVFELKKANSSLKFGELFTRGLTIGKEHISSLVNTLVLAYTGASLPIFIILVLNPNQQPLWLLLNSETIMEEVVRTLSGSIGLTLAVPITTLLAAWYAAKIQQSKAGLKSKD